MDKTQAPDKTFPSKIISREKGPTDKKHTGWEWVFHTDKGTYNSRELGEMLGVPHYTVLNRINRLGLTNPKVLHVGAMNPGRSAGGVCGNDEWKALSDKDRDDPDGIEIGEFELAWPDPYSEEKVKEYDKWAHKYEKREAVEG